jgi:hypothetical protein
MLTSPRLTPCSWLRRPHRPCCRARPDVPLGVGWHHSRPTAKTTRGLRSGTDINVRPWQRHSQSSAARASRITRTRSARRTTCLEATSYRPMPRMFPTSSTSSLVIIGLGVWIGVHQKRESSRTPRYGFSSTTDRPGWHSCAPNKPH